MQTECLNEKCSNPVDGGMRWCSMDCKRIFLIDNYSDGQCSVWFTKYHRDFKARQKKIMQEIEDSGLTAFDFLMSLGELKETCDECGKELKKGFGVNCSCGRVSCSAKCDVEYHNRGGCSSCGERVKK